MPPTYGRTPIVRRVSLAIGASLIALHGGRCADRADLDAAFFATFGQHAPFVRSIDRPVYVDTKPPTVLRTERVVFDVHADALVALEGDRYALVSYEADRLGGHPMPGEIALSYLEKTDTGWKLERLWPELLASGTFGRPANAGEETHRFGGDPLFMARSQWCGMGECSEWFGVIRLSRDRPLAYVDVLAGATSPTEGSPVMDFDGNTCRNYDVHAWVEPPRGPEALFSVRYDG